MMVAIPGAEGLFSHLQTALVSNKSGRVRVTKSARDELCDWGWLAADISARPTSIAEVVRKPVSVVQAVDAAKSGMGGVAFDLLHPDARTPYCGGNPSRPTCRRDLSPGKTRAATSPTATSSRPLSMLATTSSPSTSMCATARLPLHRTTRRPYAGPLKDPCLAMLPWPTCCVCWRYIGDFIVTVLRLCTWPAAVNRMADDASRLWHLTDDCLPRSFRTHLPAAPLLEALPPATSRDALVADLRAVQAEIAAGVVPGRSSGDDKIWSIWAKFAAALGLDPLLAAAP